MSLINGLDRRALLLGGLGVAALAACSPKAAVGAKTLLNVSYDPTRELYKAYDAYFAKQWAAQGKGPLTVNQSHGGSGKQARAVIDGLEADVVTLALAADIDVIAAKGLLAADWQVRLPNNSCPYTSTIVFLVRKGNPKAIKDWSDLVKPGVQVITPNPKTSGGARWNYLAAWAYGQKSSGSEQGAQAYVTELFKHVPVLDSGARGATNTFVKNGLGDVLLAWENEAYLAIDELGADKLEVVLPSLSVLAEPPVAVVDKVVDKRATRDLADAYLKTLYTPGAQELIASQYYRPTDAGVLAKHADRFPSLPMKTIADFGGWKAAQARHFADGGLFDNLYKPG